MSIREVHPCTDTFTDLPSVASIFSYLDGEQLTRATTESKHKIIFSSINLLKGLYARRDSNARPTV